MQTMSKTISARVSDELDERIARLVHAIERRAGFSVSKSSILARIVEEGVETLEQDYKKELKEIPR